MATHSSVFAWRIPETGEPGGLPSLWSHRVGHDWRDLAAAAAVYFYVTQNQLREYNNDFREVIRDFRLHMIYKELTIVKRSSQAAQVIKNTLAMQEMQETLVQPLGWEIPWRRKRKHTPVFLSGIFHGQRSLAGSMGSQRAGHQLRDWAGTAVVKRKFRGLYLIWTVYGVKTKLWTRGLQNGKS